MPSDHLATVVLWDSLSSGQPVGRAYPHHGNLLSPARSGQFRLVEERSAQPSGVIFDSRTMQSTPESGAEAGFDGAKKRRGRKVHLAVDTLGHLLAAAVSAANEQDRAQVAELAEQVQAVTGGTVEVAFVDRAIPANKPPAMPPRRAFGLKSSN